MQYFLIQNNTIVSGPQTLPVQWRDSTNVVHQLSTLTTVDLVALGWLPLVPSAIIPRDPYETIASTTYTINGAQVDETIVLNPLVLSDVIADKIDIISSYADDWSNGTFAFNGHTWVGDAVARQNLTGMTSAVANGVAIPAGFVWHDSTGVAVPLTATELVQMGATMLNWVNTTYQVSYFHITQVQALTNIDAVIAYDHTLGWPI